MAFCLISQNHGNDSQGMQRFKSSHINKKEKQMNSFKYTYNVIVLPIIISQMKP